MPIYSYRCTECNFDLDRMVKMDERDEQDCRGCGNPLTRKIDRPGAVWNPTRSSGAMRT